MQWSFSYTGPVEKLAPALEKHAGDNVASDAAPQFKIAAATIMFEAKACGAMGKAVHVHAHGSEAVEGNFDRTLSIDVKAVAPASVEKVEKK